MKDEKKFSFLIVLTTILTVCILSYNIFQDYFMSDIEGYLKRRAYYESVISKKGLSLHKGTYWREKE